MGRITGGVRIGELGFGVDVCENDGEQAHEPTRRVYTPINGLEMVLRIQKYMVQLVYCVPHRRFVEQCGQFDEA